MHRCSRRSSTFWRRAACRSAPVCDDGGRFRFTKPALAFAAACDALADDSSANASATPLLPSALNGSGGGGSSAAVELVDAGSDSEGEEEMDPADTEAQRLEDEELALVEAAEAADEMAGPGPG